MRFSISLFSHLLISLIFFSLVSPCFAVREGTANANIMIKRYESSQDFGRAALWREAAAECLEIISIPMTKIVLRYHTHHGNIKLATIYRRELADIEVQKAYHLKQAAANWAKSKTDPKALEQERRRIARFIAAWVPHYPDKFYDFGVYPTFFKKQRELLKLKKDYPAALNLEADAAEMCAAQYNDVTIAYFRKAAERYKKTETTEASQHRAAQYEKVRDAHLQRAALLRALARQNPKGWPPEADKRTVEPPKVKTQLTPDAAIRAAESDSRVRELLAGHTGVHEYAWFQGFAWTVSFHNHGWGNLAIALVDDKTGKVIDVLNNIGSLEAREWAESEARKDESGLNLDKTEATQIARNHKQVVAYLEAHPKARLSAAFSERYGVWMVEVIEGNREVGFVTVSDNNGKVLEVELER